MFDFIKVCVFLCVCVCACHIHTHMHGVQESVPAFHQLPNVKPPQTRCLNVARSDNGAHAEASILTSPQFSELYIVSILGH
jgi:hypothetical protein